MVFQLIEPNLFLYLVRWFQYFKAIVRKKGMCGLG